MRKRELIVQLESAHSDIANDGRAQTFRAWSKIPPPVALPPGTQLGPYEILALAGAGGTGEVYRARDSRLARDVAIKVSHERFSDRFTREARAVAALNHPNICTLYDVGPNYLVMEYIEGAPLQGPLPSEKAVTLAVQIASALAEAHGKGIIHRDLKPANILVTATGVKLLDFGLAKRAQVEDTDPTVTQSRVGTVVGTAAYMAPEQALGRPVDTRCDIFSFGSVLYEMLSGKRAFQGDTPVAVMAAVLSMEPEPLRAPPALMHVITRCLRKSPGDRFANVAEIRAALETVNARSTAQPSIAVLPFENLSADKDNEYFSDGLTEEIINVLAHVPGLKVIARTSAFSFRGKEQDVRTIAHALGVRTILQGSVRRSGSRIRVSAQLVNAEDGSLLWSERYDRAMADVFAIRTRSHRLSPRLSRYGLRARPRRSDGTSRHSPRMTLI
jgi:serine/threonine protein kinase